MDLNDALNGLSALSQETRLAAFRLLVRSGPTGIRAGDIALRLGVRFNTLSTHLRHLSQAGLIRSRRDGREIRYHADYAGFAALIGFLLEDCCGCDSEVSHKVVEAISSHDCDVTGSATR